MKHRAARKGGWKPGNCAALLRTDIQDWYGALQCPKEQFLNPPRRTDGLSFKHSSSHPRSIPRLKRNSLYVIIIHVWLRCCAEDYCSGFDKCFYCFPPLELLYLPTMAFLAFGAGFGAHRDGSRFRLLDRGVLVWCYSVALFSYLPCGPDLIDRLEHVLDLFVLIDRHP